LGDGGLEHDLASQIFFHPDSMGDPNVIAYVAYADGRPASGCMALLAYGIAVGGNGATVPWARRRGLAELCYGACKSPTTSSGFADPSARALHPEPGLDEDGLPAAYPLHALHQQARRLSLGLTARVWRGSADVLTSAS
jgi:hypothetical protein